WPLFEAGHSTQNSETHQGTTVSAPGPSGTALEGPQCLRPVTGAGHRTTERGALG
ncbi:hypothetical protein P7K49_014949, partial [Saguinus oedipus]